MASGYRPATGPAHLIKNRLAQSGGAAPSSVPYRWYRLKQCLAGSTVRILNGQNRAFVGQHRIPLLKWKSEGRLADDATPQFALSLPAAPIKRLLQTVGFRRKLSVFSVHRGQRRQ